MSEFEYPDYHDTAEAFGKLAYACDPSYAHGVICGHICFNVTFNPKNWLYSQIDKNPELQKSEKSTWDEALQMINELFDTTHKTLQAAEFEFDLFLPDDSDELMHRILALSFWCQGFILVYNLVRDNLKLSLDSQEAIDYIIDAANVYSDVEDCDEEEKAFYEVYEFIRLTPLLLFLELQLGTIQKNQIVH